MYQIWMEDYKGPRPNMNRLLLLNKVGDMEEQNKYFTPNIEDLYVGYECEIQSSWGWQKGKWPEILDQDTLSGFDKQKKGSLEATYASCLRVPFLTKEQIELEDWKNPDVYRDGGTLVYKKPTGEQAWWELTFRGENMMIMSRYIKIEYIWHLLDTGKRLSRTHFSGECKDINTFRYICKLLGIN